jgi:hypothetical protein
VTSIGFSLAVRGPRPGRRPQLFALNFKYSRRAGGFLRRDVWILSFGRFSQKASEFERAGLGDIQLIMAIKTNYLQ